MISRVNFNEVVDFLEGPGVRKWQFRDSGIKLINIRNLVEGKLDLSNTKNHLDESEVSQKYSHFLLENGDYVMASSGVTWGKIAEVKEEHLPLCLNTSIIKLKPINNNLEKRFLWHFIRSREFRKQIDRIITGSAQPNFGPSHLHKISIPLPPVDQQKKIASILDAADAYRQKTKALIEKYDELTQSLFLDMFGRLNGEKVSLSSICEINPKKSQISSLDRSLKVSFVPMTNVSEEGKLSLVEERTIHQVWSGFTYFQEDDVVFAKITPCMENGKGAIMRGLKNKIGFGTTEFHVLRPTKEVSCSEYLFYLTHSSHFRVLAELNMKGSAGQKRVPKDFFDKFKVIPPSIELQNQFAERVQAIEEQKAQAEASLSQAEDLFNSLLQRAFKGELTN